MVSWEHGLRAFLLNNNQQENILHRYDQRLVKKPFPSPLRRVWKINKYRQYSYYWVYSLLLKYPIFSNPIKAPWQGWQNSSVTKASLTRIIHNRRLCQDWSSMCVFVNVCRSIYWVRYPCINFDIVEPVYSSPGEVELTDLGSLSC